MPANASANSKLQEFYRRFPKPEQFFTAYNPDLQIRLLKKGFTPADLAARPANPTLTLLSDLYSPTTPLEWLKIQLGSLNDFTEVRTKLSSAQLNETAQLILAAWPQLTAAEVCLFIARFKIGEYGQFYGAIDPMKIMSALRKFTDSRQQSIEQTQRTQKQKKEEDNGAKAITYEEYQQIVAHARNGDKEAQKMLQKPPPE